MAVDWSNIAGDVGSALTAVYGDDPAPTSTTTVYADEGSDDMMLYVGIGAAVLVVLVVVMVASKG